MENTEKPSFFNPLDPNNQSDLEPGCLATLHLNSSVYRINLDEKMQTHHVYYQRNNPIPVVGCIIERRVKTTYNKLNEEMEVRFAGTKEPYQGWCTWPFFKNSFHDDFDTESNFTIAYGWRVEERKNDPKQPVALPVDDPEKAQEILHKALAPYYVTVPFMVAFPESDNFFFNVSLDHVPMKAIRYFDTTKNETVENPDATMEEGMIPLGIDPNKPYMSKEDRERYNAIRARIDQHMHASECVGISPENAMQALDMEELAKEFGFENGATLIGFMNFAHEIMSLPQE